MLDAATGAAAPTPVDPASGGSGDSRDYEAEIKALRAEAAKYRTERNEFKQRAEQLSPLAEKAQQLEEAGKSELQKLAEQQAALQKQLADAQAQAALANKRQQLTTLAAQQGVNPAVLPFLDVNAFNLEDTEATAEALKAFAATSRPNGGGVSNPSNGSHRPAETPDDRRQRLFGGGQPTIFTRGSE